MGIETLGNIIMSRKEQAQLVTFGQLVNGKINNKQAASILNMSVRQVQRKKKLFIEYGAPALAHKSRGKPSGRGYDEILKDRIASLYLEDYLGWNYRHFWEQLSRDHGISVSYSFVYKVLIHRIGASPRAKRHRPKSHPPRERRENAGELLQVDASKHYWLGEECGYLYLHGAIDDATGIVTSLVLMEQETILGYQLVLRDTIMRYGIPECLYTDYRTVFQSNKHLPLEEQINGAEVEKPRFVKMLEHLGIDIKSTMDPRAKGRVERLWSTLQDRLVKELAKEHIKTMEEANRYINDVFLPDFNARFASQLDYNKNHFVAVPEDFDYDLKLATFEERKILQHSYVKYHNQYYVICDEDGSKAFHCNESALVYALLDGSLKLLIGNIFYELELVTRIEPPKPQKSPKRKLTPEELSKARSEGGKRGAAASPWRHYSVGFRNYKQSDKTERG